MNASSRSVQPPRPGTLACSVRSCRFLPRGAASPSTSDLGQGMGTTLNIAAAMNAYTLTDRATWANFKNRQNLEILTEGDPALFNPYGSILVNPAKWPNVKVAD